MCSYKIRRAVRKDSSQFTGLLTGLADFEKLEPPDSEARKRILDDIFTNKWLNLFVALEEKSQRLVGYALYFYTYSSFLARRTLYLEDIFVLEDHRKMGVGKDLFARCVEEASKNDCGRMEWSVLTWNENAINFYEKLGAKRLSDWYYYRLAQDKLDALKSSLVPSRPRRKGSS